MKIGFSGKFTLICWNNQIIIYKKSKFEYIQKGHRLRCPFLLCPDSCPDWLIFIMKDCYLAILRLLFPLRITYTPAGRSLMLKLVPSADITLLPCALYTTAKSLPARDTVLEARL